MDMLVIKVMSISKKFGDFEMKTMGNYHDFYLKTDILLLVEIF